MRVDRHKDIADELEAELLNELQGITTQLRGEMTRLTRVNSSGRECKVIQIEYDIEV
tara:strand:- start:4029 stop:4199 length:171 start_codon:yes stop_codon:yes gene_type:complete